MHYFSAFDANSLLCGLPEIEIIAIRPGEADGPVCKPRLRLSNLSYHDGDIKNTGIDSAVKLVSPTTTRLVDEFALDDFIDLF